MPRFRIARLRLNNTVDLYNRRDTIDLEPTYQRLAIWDTPKKQLFIDSIINGMDIPKLYFHDLTIQSKTHAYSVIDGKQRLLALWGFLSNEYPLAQNFKFFDNDSVDAAGKYYKDLAAHSPNLYARIIGFDLPIMLVTANDIEIIEDLFSRLNVQVPLTAAEIRNAMGGPLPRLIRRIAGHDFFKESVKITNARYQHLDLAAKFLYLTHTTGFNSTKKGTLHKFTEDCRDLTDLAQALSDVEIRCLIVLDAMYGFFEDKGFSVLNSQGRALLCFHIFRLHTAQNRPLGFEIDNLEGFKFAVDFARRKSQRNVNADTPEPLSEDERQLLDYDREKQSPNDGGAMLRQYAIIRRYFERELAVVFPQPG